MSDVNLMGSAKTPQPAIYVSFRSLAGACPNKLQCAVGIHDTERATGQGMFKLATGGASVVASLVAGVLWQEVAPGAVFVLGAGAALLGLVALGAVRPARINS